LSALVQDIGPENLPTVVAKLKADPTIAPADLSDSVRQGVQKLYGNVEGPHVNYLGDVTRQRTANAAADLEQHMNANLGTVIDPVKKLDELKTNISKVGSQIINPVLAKTKPVDITDVVNYIDQRTKPFGITPSAKSAELPLSDAAQKELVGIRDLLSNDKSQLTDPNQLHKLQSAMRVEAETLIKHGGQDARAGYAISNLRQKVIDAIDASGETPGAYREALGKYRDANDVDRAFEHGHDAIMKNGRNLEDRPEFFEKWVKDADPNELQAAREGARIAYDTQMNGFKHAARRGTDIGDVDFNRRRMSALFGAEEEANMFNAFQAAKNKADTNSKLIQGSQTQMRNVQNSRFEPYNPKKDEGGPLRTLVNFAIPAAAEAGSTFFGAPIGVGTALGIGGLIGSKVASKVAGAAKTKVIKSLENERNLAYSKYALPNTPEARADLIQKLDAIASSPPKQSILRKVTGALQP